LIIQDRLKRYKLIHSKYDIPLFLLVIE